MRVWAIILVSVVVLDVLGVLGVLGDQDQDDPQPVRRKRGIISRMVRRLFGGGPPCGPPEACPVHHCRLDDAVVHGFCCGCSMPGDRVQVRCPPWLKCPYSPIPLCDDYNFMMDCCC